MYDTQEQTVSFPAYHACSFRRVHMFIFSGLQCPVLCSFAGKVRDMGHLRKENRC